MSDDVRQYHTIRLTDRNRGHLFTVVDDLYTTWMYDMGWAFIKLETFEEYWGRNLRTTRISTCFICCFYDYVVSSRCTRCLRNCRVIFRNVSFSAFPLGCVHIRVNEQTRTEENKMFLFLSYTIKHHIHILFSRDVNSYTMCLRRQRKSNIFTSVTRVCASCGLRSSTSLCD